MIQEENQDLIIVSNSQIDSSTNNDLNQKQIVHVKTNNAKTIARLLKNSNSEYMVLKNTKNVSSDIWIKFGLPAKKSYNSLGQYEIIPNYLSCFQCFQTYRFTDSSTSSTKDHKCPQELVKGQQHIKAFTGASTSLSLLA